MSQAPQMQDIHTDGIRMRGDSPLLRIDFGPFSQGFAIAHLREAATEALLRIPPDGGHKPLQAMKSGL